MATVTGEEANERDPLIDSRPGPVVWWQTPKWRILFLVAAVILIVLGKE